MGAKLGIIFCFIDCLVKTFTHKVIIQVSQLAKLEIIMWIFDIISKNFANVKMRL